MADQDDGAELSAYKTAVDEYRFQVTLNWQRTQYFFVFSTALLGIAGALIKESDHSRLLAATVILVIGLVVSIVAIIAMHTQHNYYRRARDTMTKAEEVVGIPRALRIKTTGDKTTKKLSVTNAYYILIGIVGLCHLAGIFYCVFLLGAKSLPDTEQKSPECSIRPTKEAYPINHSQDMQGCRPKR